jgi:hypothetical protein
MYSSRGEAPRQDISQNRASIERKRERPGVEEDAMDEAEQRAILVGCF